MTVKVLVGGSYINEVTRQGKVLCRNFEVGETVYHWSKDYEQFCISKGLAESVSLVSKIVEAVKEPFQATYNAAQSTIDFAKEAGVDLAQVEGTGQGGRILKADVEKAIEQKGNLTAAFPEGWPKQ